MLDIFENCDKEILSAIGKCELRKWQIRIYSDFVMSLEPKYQ